MPERWSIFREDQSPPNRRLGGFPSVYRPFHPCHRTSITSRRLNNVAPSKLPGRASLHNARDLGSHCFRLTNNVQIRSVDQLAYLLPNRRYPSYARSGRSRSSVLITNSILSLVFPIAQFRTLGRRRPLSTTTLFQDQIEGSLCICKGPFFDICQNLKSTSKGGSGWTC